MSTPTKSVKSTGRPARPLAFLALLIVGLLATALIQQATSVRLGLDLRGGTSVTLQPRATNDSNKITATAIDEAVGIIRQRVNSLGVAESEVTAQGSGTNRQIVISVPGDSGRKVVELVGQTAELRFRKVLALAAGTAGTGVDTATPVAGVSADINAKFAALDCSNSTALQGVGSDLPTDILVTCDSNGTTKYILDVAKVLGRQISKADYGVDSTSGTQYIVNLTFNGEGTKAFGDLTSAVTSLPAPQNQVAIVLDGRVVSAPSINEAIVAGSAQITGNFSQERASNLANVLKYGALPLAFDRGEVQQVSPTLGADQLHAGLLAGALGLLLVFIFSLIYYRALGLVTVGSLLVAGTILYLTFLVLGDSIGFTLTLAGIAGAIVSIGITADSFIVYFERIRDEAREGRTLRSAVESGWARARHTIIVADMVSVLAAVLLYFFAVGGVRGFAFTLGLTTLIDLLVVFIFTKPLVTLLARVKFFSSGHKLSGFSTKSIGSTKAIAQESPQVFSTEKKEA
jgi:preprotein translocase subunit SecD